MPTLVAPIDIVGNPDPAYYFELAKQYCPHYERCETIIYHNKGYMCCNAGSMDWLFHDGENGWSLDDREHSFDRTNEEVETQGKLFCHRCYFSILRHPEFGGSQSVPQQLISSKSLVTETNYQNVDSNAVQLVQLNVPANTCAAESADDQSV